MKKFDSHWTVTSLDAVGQFFGVTRRRVQDWITAGCPGESKNYNLRLIKDWWLENRSLTTSTSNPESTSTMEKLKEQQLLQKIRAEELDYARTKECVVPRVHVTEYLERAAARYRQAGDLLRKHHGSDAQKILNDAIDAVAKDIQGMFSPDSDSE